MVASLADELTEKIVISCINPLGFEADGPGLVLEESVAQETLVPTERVVGAHHVAALSLWRTADPTSHEDVLTGIGV